jgi:ACT domain-containing protein
MDKEELKELVRGEVSAALAEGGTDTLRKSFYAYSDGVYGLEDMTERFPKDKTLAKIVGEFKKLLDKVESHLNDNHKGWD